MSEANSSDNNSSDNNDNESVHSDNYRDIKPMVKKHNIMQRCESCLKNYNQDAYIHETEYNFEISGIKTCVNCFIHFNPNKFIKRIGLTQKEKELLSDYIDIFVESHDTNDCKIMEMFSQCLLCEKTDEYDQENKINNDNNSETNNSCESDNSSVSDELSKTLIPDKLTTSDLIVISNPDTNDFVLIL
jgi:hypothetical protein